MRARADPGRRWIGVWRGLRRRLVDLVDGSAGEEALFKEIGEAAFAFCDVQEDVGVDDSARATKALKGIVGKRLTYRRTGEAANA
jgi:hypothetical protein